MSQLGSTSIRKVLHSGEVDYSFCELPTLEDVLDETPRSGPSQAQVETLRNQEDGGKSDSTESTFDTASRPWEEKKLTSVPRAKTALSVLKLNNNSLSTLASLPTVFPKILPDLMQLRILDLSFNLLTSIEECIPNSLPYLHVLKLHGNAISKLQEVDKLAVLPFLINLTLNGNEVEKISGYRNYVTSALPGLKSLDVTGITPKDRQKAEVWRKIHGPKKRMSES